MSLDDEKEVCRRGQLAPRPYWIILGTMSWLPFNRVTHFPSFQMWRGEKKILATDGLAECGEFRTTFSNSFPTLPFNFPLVFSSIFTRLSGSADRHLNRNRSMKRWYACNALRAASPLLHSDFEMTTRPNLRFSQIQPLQLRFNSFSIRSLPFYRQYIYMCIYWNKRGGGKKPMKNIVIREKSRKMSREGYDARWNRRITLEGGQLFLIYIYIRRPITGNRGLSCSCSKWSDRRVENVEKRSSFRIFYWLPGNWIIISSKSIAAQKLIKRSPILIDN